MHIIGKILAWLLVIGAGASTTLMSRQLQIRNSYTKKLESLKKENEERAKRIAKKEKQLIDLNTEYDRVMYGWDRYWDKKFGAKYTTADPAKARLVDQNSFQVGVGTNEGIGNLVQNPAVKIQGDKTFESRLRQVLHVFKIGPNNSSLYVGPFQFPANAADADVTPNGVRMVPMWKLRQGEYDGWGSGPQDGWRYRAAVEGGYPEQLQSYYLTIAALEARIAIARKNLVKRNDELKAAQETVNRYREIVAGTDGTGGIVAALDREDEKRNQQQTEVDALRREIKVNVDLRTVLTAAIRKLAATLPAAPKTAPKKP